MLVNSIVVGHITTLFPASHLMIIFLFSEKLYSIVNGPPIRICPVDFSWIYTYNLTHNFSQPKSLSGKIHHFFGSDICKFDHFSGGFPTEDTDREIETGGETMSEIDTAGVGQPKTGLERRKLGYFIWKRDISPAKMNGDLTSKNELKSTKHVYI